MGLKNRKKVVLALSGGVDSTTCALHLLELGYALVPVYFSGFSFADNGQRQAVERSCALIDAQLEVVDFSFYLHLPISMNDTAGNRIQPNALFFFLSTLGLIAIRTGAEFVAIGLTKEDALRYPLIISSFLDLALAINKSTYESQDLLGSRFEAIFPLAGYSKSQVVQEGLRLGINFQNTFSCARDGLIHCGQCPCCQDRMNAFKLADIPDTTLYTHELG